MQVCLVTRRDWYRAACDVLLITCTISVGEPTLLQHTFLLQVSAIAIQEQTAGYDQVASMIADGALQHPSTATAVYDCFYQPYLARQQQEVAQLKRDEALVVPSDLDYTSLQLSGEDREKLLAARPRTLAQAQRIPGVTPQAVVLLLQMIKRHQLVQTVRQRQQLQVS